jgi:hypothetical protein
MIRLTIYLVVIGLLTKSLGGFFFEWIDHPRITSPRSGDVLQGVVPVIGSTNVNDFSTSEVSFSYNRDGENDNWFAIQRGQEPLKNQLLANWDTTTITDGIYRLRVVVSLQDGQKVETIVENLKVRNYSVVDVPTSPVKKTPTTISPKSAVSTKPAFVLPTPTRFTPNPAEITSDRFFKSLIEGSSFTLIVFILIGIYLLIRSYSKRSGR